MCLRSRASGETRRVISCGPPHGARPETVSVLSCVVSRQALIDSKYSTVICAPIYTAYDELATQVPLNVEDG